MNKVQILLNSTSSYTIDYYDISNIDSNVIDEIISNQQLPINHNLRHIGTTSYCDTADSHYMVYLNGECINENEDYIPIADLMTVVMNDISDSTLINKQELNNQYLLKGIYPDQSTIDKAIATLNDLQKVANDTKVQQFLSPINSIRVLLLEMSNGRDEIPCLVVDTLKYSEYSYTFEIADDFSFDKLNFIADPFNYYTKEENGEIICLDYIAYDDIVCVGKPELEFEHSCTMITKGSIGMKPIDHPTVNDIKNCTDTVVN